MEAPLGSLTVSRPAHRAVASGLLSCIVLLSFCQLPRLHSGFNPDLNFGLEVVTMATCNMPAPPLLLFYSSVFPTSAPGAGKSSAWTIFAYQATQMPMPASASSVGLAEGQWQLWVTLPLELDVVAPIVPSTHTERRELHQT